MIKPAYLLFFFLFLAWQLPAQDLPRTVVGSAGAFHDNLLFGDLHFTVGEVSVARYDTANGELDEGFHRGYFDLVVRADEQLPPDWDVTIYPNPTTQYLQFRLPDEGSVHVQLFNSLGQLIQEIPATEFTRQMDLRAIPAGAYWLRMLDAEGRTASYQIQKMDR
ncbi:MAG: T9SS type A sorting domain-containing protein [Bacteroidota bacterium]